MAKNQGSNKATTTAPAAAAPAPEGQDMVKDLAISFPADDINEGINVAVNLLKEHYPDADIDNLLATHFFTETSPENSRILIVLPSDMEEGINETVAQLRAAYTDEAVDQALAARFKTEPEVADTHTPHDLVAVTGFELTFPLDALADNITEGLSAVQKALNEQRTPEGVVFPQALVGFQFPLAVLERYIQGTLLKERRLEDAELVFADPALDSHLKTLNFSRYLQGLEDTYFYLRFL